MPAPTRSAEQVRRDLTGALAAGVTDKGYTATTIADVVAHAHVSKRTFYQHFADKEECLMALYEHVCDRLMVIIRSAAAPDLPWPRLVHDGTTAYLAALDAMPAFTRTLLIEMQAAGHRAFKLRQETLGRFATMLIDLVEAGRPANPQVVALTRPQALAVVGGIHELLLHAVDPYAAPAVPPSPGARSPGARGTGTGPFSALHADVVRLIAAVLSYRG